jgi:hypothetical protein
MTARVPLPLLLPALLMAACNSGTVSAPQANETAAANTSAAAASQQRASGAAAATACNFSAWSSDPDPRGLNVRAGPSPTAPVLGALPPPEPGEDIEVDFGTTFDVVESRNGWFRIANARRWTQVGHGPSTIPSGWISGRYLTFQLQTDKVFEAPDPSSPTVLTSWMDNGTLTQFNYRNPTECRGEWVRLTVVGPDRAERQGWVRGICGIQETTCDGVRGDLVDASEPRGWTAMD